jgi:hypothetical protein
MWKCTVVGMGFMSLLLLGCSEKAVKKEQPKPLQIPLIHPLFFQEEIASQLNFPFWFNDSILREQQIHTITWTIFRSTEVEEETASHKQLSPKTKTTYTFDGNGRLIGLQRNDYSEGLTISSKKYVIIPSSDRLFSHVKQQQLTRLGDEDVMETYTFMKPVRNNERIQQYDDVYSDVRYHFFPDKKYHGALSIDSIGHPGSTDWVVLGTPFKPRKRYQVYNTVKESNVTRYRYRRGNYPERISWSDYPFIQKRSFSYSGKGVFTGYIDSTYIDQSFVTRNVSWLKYDRKMRPVQVTHRKGHAASGANYETIEKITYTTFTKP